MPSAFFRGWDGPGGEISTREAVVVDTLETAPADATHWSTRDLGKKHGISETTVAEIWRAFRLKPWRQDSFKISPIPSWRKKTRDIGGLYLTRRTPPPFSLPPHRIVQLPGHDG